MDYLFFAFSNSQDDPLPSLLEEDRKIYDLLAGRQQRKHYTIHRDSYATRETILKELIRLREDLILFHFSGHAGRDQLFLDGEEVHGAGISGLLDQCPRLKLIVLNGCSTSDQVSRLAKLSSKPLVVATHASIGDQAAMLFAISFYQVLADYGTIEKAFEIGLASAATVRKNPITPERGYIPTKARELWGLYAPSNADQKWKLPFEIDSREIADFEPNNILIDKLIDAFATHSDTCRKIKERVELGEEFSSSKKKVEILKSLPHPISEQLRKLMVPNTHDSNLVFYDRLGLDRLKQLHVTFQTTIELICYVMIAQLWDFLNESETPTPLELKEQLKVLFLDDTTHQPTKKLLNIILLIHNFLSENEAAFFIREFSEISQDLSPDSTLAKQCDFFDKIYMEVFPKQSINQQLAESKCIEGEEVIADLLSRLSFIINYIVISVKDIDVIKYKHSKKPLFKHKLIKLVQTFVGLETENENLEEFMDNSSVILMSQKGTGQYLNLSPFIFDENAFINKNSDDAKLRFFQNYIKSRDVYWFKHVYKPFDQPIEVDDKNLSQIKIQFNAFAKTLFKQPMQQVS